MIKKTCKCKSLEKIKCRVCGKLFWFITTSHLKTHKITTEEYKKKFPNARIGLKGRHHDRIARLHMSEAGKGKPKSAKHSRNISKALTGLVRSQENNKNNSKAQKKYLAEHPERANQLGNYNKGKNLRELYGEEYWSRRLENQRLATLKPGYHEKRSKASKDIWKYMDPKKKEEILTKIYNKMLNRKGYGYKGNAPDGHYCDSKNELALEVWLVENKLKHEPHPLIIDEPGRRADQLVNGIYIEFDGLKRGKKFWSKKYRKCSKRHIVIDNIKMLNDKLLEKLRR